MWTYVEVRHHGQLVQIAKIEEDGNVVLQAMRAAGQDGIAKFGEPYDNGKPLWCRIIAFPGRKRCQST